MHHILRNRTVKPLAITALAVAAAAGAQSPVKFEAETLTLKQFPWGDEERKPPGPAKPGITTIYLRGSETAAQPYTVVYRFAAGARQLPHSHPDDRSCFVLAGTWLFGYGEKFEESRLKKLTAGAYYTEPGNMPHFAASNEEGATVQCTSTGPSGVRFVNPADAS